LLAFDLYSQDAISKNHSPSSFMVEGRILDGRNSSPIAFATVMLLNAFDSTLAKGAISDTSGVFKIEKISSGNYRIKISYIGYQNFDGTNFTLNTENPYKLFGNISLNITDQILNEVVVQGEKPPVERKVGKVIVNPSNSVFKTSNTALDVLSRSPGLIVNGQGGITMQGNTTPVVTIDGKTVPLTTEEIKNIPAGDIDEIEIISNPSANFEGDRNAIINIKLKRDKSLGLNGSAYGEYGRNKYFNQYAAGVSANYKTKKLVLYGRYGFSQYNNFIKADLTRRFTGTEELETLHSNSRINTHPINHQVNLGLDYFLGKKSSVGFLIRANQLTENNNTNSNTSIQRENESANSLLLDTKNENDIESANRSINLNYRGTLNDKGSELRVDLDYAGYKNKQDQLLNTIYSFPDVLNNSLRGSFSSDLDIRSIKVDYILPFSKSGDLNIGFKSNWINTRNDMLFDTLIDNKWDYDEKRSNKFSYDENTIAGYVTYNKEIDKVSLILGLRVENTRTTGNSLTLSEVAKRNYTRWLPSLHLNYKINTKSILELSFIRKLARPGFRDLNPFIFYIDPYTYTEGNPFLLPKDINKSSISYSYKEYSTSLSYIVETNLFSQMPEQNEQTKVTKFTRVNLGRSDFVTLDLWIPVKITQWWKVQNYFIVSYNRYQSRYLEGSFDKDVVAYNITNTNTFSLPQKVNLQVRFNYESPNVSTFYTQQSQWNLSIGVNRSILKNKGNLTLNMNDIFWTQKDRVSVKYLNMDSKFIQRGSSQYANIRLTYKFGQSTYKRNNKNSGTIDEENRVKTSL
jgi:hypothetical protein